MSPTAPKQEMWQRVLEQASPADRERLIRNSRSRAGYRGAMRRLGRWDEYLNTFGNHDRWLALVRIVSRITDDAEYWRLVGDVWVMTDFPGREIDLWRALLSKDRPGREHLMDTDREGFDAWRARPERVTAYRGFAADGGEFGLSWTTDLDRARWFARRFPHLGGTPRIATTTVGRDAVVAAFSERRESEFVILEPGSPIVTSLEEGA